MICGLPCLLPGVHPLTNRADASMVSPRRTLGIRSNAFRVGDTNVQYTTPRIDSAHIG